MKKRGKIRARSAWLSCVLTTVRAGQTNQREDCYAICLDSGALTDDVGKRGKQAVEK